MASSSRNTNSWSSSPSKRHSRIADAVQVPPYLTHMVKHHGQITLIPPENTARVRKTKKKRLPLPAENSTVSLELPRTPPSRSRPQTPRPQSSNSAPIPRPTAHNSGSNIHTSGQRSRTYLCIPDFPPPSFEEAVLGAPSPRSMPASSQTSDAPRPVSAMAHLTTQEPAASANAISATSSAPPSSPETESVHSESSHSSLEEAGGAGPRSLWEQDIEAGYSLEERVQRELERRRLAESLPHAPPLQPSEQKDVANDSQSQTNVDDILLAIQRKYREHRLRLEVASQNDIALATPSIQEQMNEAEPVASTSAEVRESLVFDSGVPESEEPLSRTARRKDKEKAVHDTKNHDKNSSNAGKDSAEDPLSKIREVLNDPLRAQPGPSGSVSEDSLPEFTLPSTTAGHSASALQSVGTSSHTASTSHSTATSSSKDASIHTSTNADLCTSSSEHPNHAPVSSLTVSSASLSPAAISSSVPPASSSNRPLPTPPITPPTTPSMSAFASRRPLPSAPSGGPSVRDRISAFESLQSRPIPPPPPMPKVVRRPPPVPAPSSFDRARRFFDVRTGNGSSFLGDLGTCTARREGSEDATTSPLRRRPPPPVPTRRMLDGGVLSQPSGSSGTAWPSSCPSNRVDAVNPIGSATTNDMATPPIETYQTDALHGRTAGFVDLPASLREDVIESSAQIEATSLEMAEGPEEVRDAANPFEGSSFVDTNRSELEVEAPASPQYTSVIAEPEASAQLSDHRLVVDGDTVPIDESHNQESSTSASAPQDTLGRPDATIGVHDDVGNGPARTQNSSPSQAGNEAPSTTTTLQPLQPVFTGLTDLDLLLARLDDPDFTFNGRSYEDLLLLEEIIGPAFGSSSNANRTQFEDIPLGRVEVLRRRVTKDGRIKLKLALLGVDIDKCGICLVQFKDGVFACLLPCRHAFHEKCLRLWMRRGNTCPLCRGPLLE